MKRQASDLTALFRAHLTASQKKKACAEEGMALLEAGDEAGAHKALKRAEGFDLEARRIEARVKSPERRVGTKPT